MKRLLMPLLSLTVGFHYAEGSLVLLLDELTTTASPGTSLPQLVAGDG